MSSNFYDGFPELDDSQKENCELNEDWEDNYIEHNPNLRNDFRVENNFQNFDFDNNSFKKIQYLIILICIIHLIRFQLTLTAHFLRAQDIIRMISQILKMAMTK